MLSIASLNTEKVPILAVPDGPVDGALIVTVLSGDGTWEPDAAEPLGGHCVSGTLAGLTTYNVKADVDTGSGVQTIEDTIEYTVNVAQATAIGLTAGAPVPK